MGSAVPDFWSDLYGCHPRPVNGYNRRDGAPTAAVPCGRSITGRPRASPNPTISPPPTTSTLIVCGEKGYKTSSCAAGDATTRNSTCPPTSSSRAYRPPLVPRGRAEVIPRPDETAAHLPAGQAWLARCVFQPGRRPHRRHCPPSLSGQTLQTASRSAQHRVRDGLQDVRQVLDDVASEI